MKRVLAFYNKNFCDGKDLRDGCKQRAENLYDYVALYCPSAAKQLKQKWIGGDLRPPTGYTWRYHTALSFTDADKIEFVLDPAFSGDFIEYNNWKKYNCRPNGACKTETTVARGNSLLADATRNPGGAYRTNSDMDNSPTPTVEWGPYKVHADGITRAYHYPSKKWHYLGKDNKWHAE